MHTLLIEMNILVVKFAYTLIALNIVQVYMLLSKKKKVFKQLLLLRRWLKINPAMKILLVTFLLICH